MAIIFNKTISSSNILLAFNNNVIEFYTDSSVAPDNATITVGGETVSIFPNPTGIFRYNFKELIISIINKSNYADNLEIDLDHSYTYDWTDEVLLTDEVLVTINLSNDTTETSTINTNWLSGYVDLYKWKQKYPSQNILVDEITLLQPVNGSSYYNYYLKYYYGYPFDISIFRNTGTDIKLYNSANGLEYTFLGASDTVTRLALSDGRIDTTIEDVLPLQNGVNDVLVTKGSTDFNIRLYKETEICPNGLYIKFINSLGGYSFYLFSKGQMQNKTSSVGSLFNDNNNLEDTVSPFISMGKTSNKNIKVQQKRVTENEKVILEDLINSAKVYVFTGVPYSKNTFNDWLEVELKSGTFLIENSKDGLYQFDFEFNLPKSVTRSL